MKTSHSKIADLWILIFGYDPTNIVGMFGGEGGTDIIVLSFFYAQCGTTGSGLLFQFWELAGYD